MQLLTRRSILAMLGLAAADPERLIWQPGKRLISIPAPQRFTILSQDLIIREALDSLERQFAFRWRERKDPCATSLVMPLPRFRVGA